MLRAANLPEQNCCCNANRSLRDCCPWHVMSVPMSSTSADGGRCVHVLQLQELWKLCSLASGVKLLIELRNMSQIWELLKQEAQHFFFGEDDGVRQSFVILSSLLLFWAEQSMFSCYRVKKIFFWNTPEACAMVDRHVTQTLACLLALASSR